MQIRVETLGSVTVTVDGKPAASLLTRPIRSAAFLYLILDPHPTRDSLIELFWPDREPERARRACNQMLYQLRHDLGGEWLGATGNRFEVRAEVHTDLRAFERALEDGRVSDALALYRGPFLADLGSVGGVGFEHWAERIRARAEREHRKVRRAAIEAAVAGGDISGALLHTRKWVDLDPLDDEANHRRIELLSLAGARDDALRCYELYSERMRRELNVEPLEETVRLVESIRNGTIATTVPPLDLPARLRPAVQPAAATGTSSGSVSPRWRPHGIRLAGVTLLAVLMLVLYRPWSRPQSARVVAPGDLNPAIIAILPFENWSQERELEVVANGMRETLALELHRNERLSVVSNMAVRREHEAGLEPESIARRFNAGTLISGSITRVGSDVRLFIGVTDARGVDAYVPDLVERPDTQVHLLEADLLAAMTRFLRERLGDRIELARTLSKSLTREAYTAYEEGRLLLREAQSLNRDGAPIETTQAYLGRADAKLEEARASAPDWVAPVLMQARVAREVARVYGTRDTARYRICMTRAQGAVDRALLMGQDSAEALALRGSIRMRLGVVVSDTALLRRAEEDLEASAALDAKRAATWRDLSFLHMQKGELELAQRLASRALESDPFDRESADLVSRMTWALRSVADATGADVWCRRGTEEHPDDFRFTECILANAAILNDPSITIDSAASLVKRANALDPPAAGSDPVYGPLYREALYAIVLLRQGQAEKAQDVMESAVTRAREHGLEQYLDYDRAYFELLTGDTLAAADLYVRYTSNNPRFRAFAAQDRRWPDDFIAQVARAR